MADPRAGRSDETLDRARQDYQQRKRRFAARAGKIEDDGYEEESDADPPAPLPRLRGRAGGRLNLRNSAAISNEVMHRIEHELDLAQARLKP